VDERKPLPRVDVGELGVRRHALVVVARENDLTQRRGSRTLTRRVAEERPRREQLDVDVRGARRDGGPEGGQARLLLAVVQGLTLVQFSAQLEPCMTHKNTLHIPNTP